MNNALKIGVVAAVLAGVLVATWFGFQAPEAEQNTWWCPMHPFYKVKKYGICPYCNMALEKYSSGQDEEGEPVLTLTDQQIQQAGVRTEKVKSRNLVREISTTGMLEMDHERHWFIDARFDGWIEKLYVNNVGETVEKGDPVALIYSPQLYATQREYLLSKDDPTLGPASRKRLELLGISEEEIKKLEEKGEASNQITIRSPYTGVVVHRRVRAGMKIPTNGHLIEVADLGVLWLFADIYSRDLGNIELDMEARINVDANPGETFSGTVDLIEPRVRAKTQTARIRLQVRNDDGLLIPGQFARLNLLAEAPDTLSVTEQAVIPTGRRDIVIVSRGGGRFAAREVTIGRRWLTEVESREPEQRLPFFTGHARFHEVLGGLEEGDVVVTAGAFLLHAETQIRQIFEKMIGPKKEKKAVRSAWTGAILESPHVMDDLPFLNMGEHMKYGKDPSASWHERFPKIEEAMAALLESYFLLHRAVFDGNKTLAVEYAEGFPSRVADVTKPITDTFDPTEADRIRSIATDLDAAAKAVISAENVKEQRKQFGVMSAAVERWIAAYGSPRKEMYQFICGMAEGMVGSPTERWFQPDDELRNPFGMPRCGSVEKQLRRSRP